MSKAKPYTAVGKILSISPVQQVTEKFRKVAVVIDQTEASDRFDSHLVIEFCNDDIKLLKGCSAGTEVEVEFWISSRKSTTRPGMYFTSARGRGIKSVGLSNAATADHAQSDSSGEDGDDFIDIPF